MTNESNTYWTRETTANNKIDSSALKDKGSGKQRKLKDFKSSMNIDSRGIANNGFQPEVADKTSQTSHIFQENEIPETPKIYNDKLTIYHRKCSTDTQETFPMNNERGKYVVVKADVEHAAQTEIDPRTRPSSNRSQESHEITELYQSTDDSGQTEATSGDIPKPAYTLKHEESSLHYR